MTKHGGMAYAQRSWPWLALCTAAVLSACRSAEDPSVCPSCKPLAGGETTSFERPGGPQGSLSACYEIYQSAHVSADQATQQGYPIASVRSRVEREFEVPLHWHARESELGGAAIGYEPNTRVHVQTQISDYYAVEPDRSRCDVPADPDCSYEGALCENWLRIDVRVQLDTLDGAVHAAMSGSTVTSLSGSLNSDLNLSASVDVTEVMGRLQLFPRLPTPYSGVLDADFNPDGSEGELQVVVAPAPDESASVQDAGLASYDPPLGANVSYQPLLGAWGRAEDLVDAAPTVTPPGE